MSYNFTLRIHQSTINSVILSCFNHITISNITIISKSSKFEDICLHKGNQKKFGYTIKTSKSFNKISGSHSTPTLTFKGEYIDVIVKNFPRYPTFTQEHYIARNCLNGYGYIGHVNKGYPIWLNYRKYEFINN